MKSLIRLIIFISSLTLAQAQSKYNVKTGEIKFASKAQLELIQASSGKLQGAIVPASNQFAFLINIPTFQGFNSEMQRKHFNENYMESEKFPLAKFSGKIIEQVDFENDNTIEVRAKGDLEIHGEKQTRIIKVKITVKGNDLIISSRFLVPLADHSITIPKIVSQKIATEIEVEINATLSRTSQ